MIKYRFCTASQELVKRTRFRRREQTHEEIQTLADSRILKVLKEKLGLLPFLFSGRLLKEFDSSDYVRIYQEHLSSSGVPKTQLDCFNFLKDSDKDRLGAYINFLYNEHEWKVVISKQLSRLADLSAPHKWYPQSRKMKRRFIFHHGPTNSGKTLSAVQALEKERDESETGRGLYMAPLRLLAWQIQQKLAPCSLITGQEKIVMDSKLTSCTIETANLTKDYKLAVIDEIQMIGDKERGWSWTKAILNTKSEVIHLCGESRPVELISKILALTGDSLEQKRYPRLSRLILKNKIFKFKYLKPGDCIIAFSTRKLHEIRLQIFKQYGIKSAIIYGKLPPDVRKKQAEDFNNGTLPVLLSTNAIGMGLNLQIKRIIFYQTQKIDERNGPKKPLDDYMIQQIAGRAGRGLTDGEVYCMNRTCLGRVRNALRNVNQTLQIKFQEEEQEEDKQKEINQKESQQNNHFLNRPLSEYQKSISHGMLFIQFGHLENYYFTSSFLNQTNPRKIKLSKTIEWFFRDATTAEHYSIIEAPKFASSVAKFQQMGLNAFESFNFELIPDPKSLRQFNMITKEIAEEFVSRQPVGVPRYILERIKQNLTLKQLETIYSLLEVYIWLANKYELAFVSSEQVVALKENVCMRIDSKLKGFRIKQSY